MLGLVVTLSLAQLARGGDHVCEWNEVVGALAPKLENATRVEVFLLTGESSPSASVDLFRRKKFDADERWHSRQSLEIAHYPVVAVDPNPPADLLPRLLGVLRRAWFPCSTWKEEGKTVVRGKLCGPLRPVIAYRFQTPDGPIELLLCFGCDQAALTFAGATTVPIHLDFASRELLDVALTSFPFAHVLNEIVWERERRARQQAWIDSLPPTVEADEEE